MTTEQLLYAHFDRVYRAPKRLIGLWAAMAAIWEKKILVVMDTDDNLLAAQEDAEYALKAMDRCMTLRSYRAVGSRSIYHHDGGRIKFQATNAPGRGLSRDWFVLYAEEES